ncbi:MAG: beta-ketoacyl-ACP synthase II [Planctomycetota bacterium]|jgi:3-oxoacyl-[acyl-carrier-protein] synthase II|nr:beta-ketoacyl-ACP synthase II [Planctomycetia bacterium]MDO7678864.1 beta-ketoacyl-ACP synthase II [Pirellulales bacterium]RLS32934.1 MAG: beta-ketoacyl-[acyl-carrier-protein] synthase II [Planctomycetota bacterium]RLS59835.1 MAG: beta-ketoacyl-[acyl-carrier-protein] synthase II [Planctomycetota bacterium]TSA09547.1 MAG: beta-ketoacyl-[acyl-carrier-protein] synthase II [Planctomycetaceae bacterium]
MKRRVVVTGLGLVTSLGRVVEEFWDRILRGESGIGPITLFDTKDYFVRFGGEVAWNPEGLVSAKELRRLDRFTQFALASAIDAVKDSGIDFSTEDSYRCGVVIGSGIGGLSEFETQHARLLTKGVDKVSPFTIPKLMVNCASGHVSSQFGVKGPNWAVATACASAANSIGDAMRSIQWGDADVMITGGSEAALTPMGLAGFQNMRALSERSDAPQKASRPFDSQRDGFVLSEGAGVLVIEELEHAKHRGAKIYGELMGYGASGDAGHITQPDEDGRGAARAMNMALVDAGKNADEIEYINAHGTSTPLGDKAETIAVKKVFGESAKRVMISSTKSQLGHTLGASGGIEMVVCALVLERGVIPPTINLEYPDPECDLDYTPNTARQKKISLVMSNSFGFGGHNASLILGKYISSP